MKMSLYDIHKDIEKSKYSNGVKEKIKSMLQVVSISTEDDISLEYEDFKLIMDHGNVVLCGVGEYKGIDAATQAIKLAIEDSSAYNRLMNKFTGILVHFIVHPDFPIIDIADAMSIINDEAHYDADIIFGTTSDKTLSKSSVKVSILLTRAGNNIG